MFIKKIDEEFYDDIQKTLEFMNLQPFEISQVRFFKEYCYAEKDENDEIVLYEEDGYIIEYKTPSKLQRVVMGDGELFYKGEPPSRAYQSHLGKSVICHQTWSEYPVIYGNLREPWDDIEDYEAGGMYSDDDYSEFGSKYN